MNIAKEPTERLYAHGVAVLSDADLCAIVGIPHLATESLRDVYAAGTRQMAIKYKISPAKVAKAQAAIELGRRFCTEPAKERQRLDTPELVASYLARHSAREGEAFGFVALDAKHRVLGETIVCTGGRHSVAVTPADIFQAAIPFRPRSIVVFHNHPSGDPHPSEEDKALTYRLVRAGEVLGIAVVDHIVLGGTSFSSFKQLGLI